MIKMHCMLQGQRYSALMMVPWARIETRRG